MKNLEIDIEVEEDKGVDVNMNEIDIDDDEPNWEDMAFDNAEDMFTYYKEYGKCKGFPVMRRSSRKGCDGNVRYVTFACGRSGFSKTTSSIVLRPQPNAKIGCNAKICGCVDDIGKWRIRTLVLEHNHELLSPSKSKYFRCNRSINIHAKRKLEINDRAGIKVAQSSNALVIEAGGHDNITFTARDCRNHVDKQRRLRLGEGDVVALQNYLLKMQAEDDRFFFSLNLDDEGRLKNVFWADPRSRAAYKSFGDVVTFDTTYLTNKYDMPFAPFVGVNHHGHSILLGCGLISHEDTETFTWLFRTWLSCMSNITPIGIITDQDRAMKKAIEIVFPTTRHRWCLWHILKKVPEKLGGYTEYNAITQLLHSAVYDSQNVPEFDETLRHMLVEYDLSGNEWLTGLYEERHYWVPCFLKNSFWAGMSTTQCSESMNAFFDGYVNSKTTLKQFVEQYGHALRSKVEKEVQEDAKSLSQQLPCVTQYAMEKQVQDVYTISKFKEFQQELISKLYCEVVNSMGSEHEVREDVWFGEGKKRTVFNVHFQKENGEITCSCSRFQFRGIICRHAITLMIRNDVEVLPEKYILKRWRRDVRRCHSRVKMSYDIWNSTEEQVRYDKICANFAEVADMVAGDIDNSNYVLDWIENLRKDCSKNFFTKKTVLTPGKSSNNTVVSSETVVDNIRDPKVTRAKGRPRSRRIQSTKFTKRRKKKLKISAEDVHVNDQLHSVEIPTQESNMLTIEQVPSLAPYVPATASYVHKDAFVMTDSFGEFQQLLLQQYNEGDNICRVPKTEDLDHRLKLL